MWNSYHLGQTIVIKSATVIVLTTQTRITHPVHAYYMIELFYVFRSVSCILHGILDKHNIDLSLQNLPGPIKLIIKSDISCWSCTYPLTIFMVQRHIRTLTLTHKTPRKNLLTGRKTCGSCPYLFQGRVNLSKRTSQIIIFYSMLS